jgi:hypothetical protein
MPCYTITSVSVEFLHVDVQTLAKALEDDLGYKVVVNADGSLSWRNGSFRDGTLTVANDAETIRVKKAYGGAVVTGQAKRYGWKVKELGNYEYEVVK